MKKVTILVVLKVCLVTVVFAGRGAQRLRGYVVTGYVWHEPLYSVFIRFGSARYIGRVVVTSNLVTFEENICFDQHKCGLLESYYVFRAVYSMWNDGGYVWVFAVNLDVRLMSTLSACLAPTRVRTRRVRPADGVRSDLWPVTRFCSASRRCRRKLNLVGAQACSQTPPLTIRLAGSSLASPSLTQTCTLNAFNSRRSSAQTWATHSQNQIRTLQATRIVSARRLRSYASDAPPNTHSAKQSQRRECCVPSNVAPLVVTTTVEVGVAR